MAFPSFIIISPTFPIPQTLNHFKLSAHNQSETPISESDTEKKKKTRRKLRPSFYEQTIQRWSLKLPSERSSLPWQKPDQSPTGSISPKVSILKSTEVRIGGDSQNPPSNLDLGPDLQNRAKLGFSENNGGNGTDREDETSSWSIPMGTRKGLAPWAHGGESKEAHLFAVNNGGNTTDREDDVSSSTVPTGMKKGLAPWAHGGESKEAHLLYNTSSSDLSVSGTERSFIKRPPMTKMLNSSDSINVDNLPDDEILVQKGPGSSESIEHSRITHMETPFSGESKVSLIIDQLKNSSEEKNKEHEDEGHASKSRTEIAKSTNTVPLPWERNKERDKLHKSNTSLAETTIPENELRRLRNVALRMKERMKVGPAGVTEAIVENIHKKWKEEEVVKLHFEGPPTLNMKRTHDILERRTGGLVIWRSGSSVVLYRGMTYELPCVKTYSILATNDYHDEVPSSKFTHDISANNADGSEINSEVSTDSTDVDTLLDQLGPRYKDWTGCNPLPVDADLLPGIVPGYQPPYRLLPHKTRRALKDSQMTSLRRLARTMSPHFALGRNRQHQGLARAMVKLWEKSSIVKIAIKRGLPNTCNERMAEEIKNLTGGVLVSRNKEYIVFYRGNDYLTPSVRDALVEKEKLATVKYDEEEEARLRASAMIVSDAQSFKGRPMLAGTLAETLEAKNRWGNQPSDEDKEKMKKDFAFAKHASHVRYLEKKLDLAKAKVRKAERALAKVQEFLDPAKLPNDLETITDEERFLFRNMGLKMRSFHYLGRRGVFDGTVQNMHLSWKHRELVKILVKGKSFGQVKHIAISLEAESGGVLISLDKTTKGYAIIIYRGKNYMRPRLLRPKNLLTRRQALARSIELQRREALRHHILGLQKRIEMLKTDLDKVDSGKNSDSENFVFKVEDAYHSDDDMEDEGEEAYLQTYSGSDEDDDEDIAD